MRWNRNVVVMQRSGVSVWRACVRAIRPCVHFVYSLIVTTAHPPRLRELACSTTLLLTFVEARSLKGVTRRRTYVGIVDRIRRKHMV